MSDKPHDLVVFGATSFVGQILARYLLQYTGEELDWAIAGRSAEKLDALRESLGERAARLPTIIADATDEAALRKLCSKARVVVSTVGPFALHGEPLVRACVETGTDYCDITGEVQWIRRMIDRHEARARETGARIVNCCGFDSIPSDLGVYFLQQEAIRRFGLPCPRVKMRVRSMRGGLSGGTVASMMNVIKEVSADRALRRLIASPYALCPPERRPAVRQPSVSFAHFDHDFRRWAAPFIMSAINTRVVHRSNALLENAYGADFRYDEAMLTGRGLSGSLGALGLAAGLAGLTAAAAIGPVRWTLQRFVLPKPGEGPNHHQQEMGFFEVRFTGWTADEQTIRIKVTGNRDPGYGSTARMLGQAAACLAVDIGKSARRGGFWTPAAIFGERLVRRLVAHAGLTFELLD